MSNIDKQWLQQKIADMEAASDEIPFGLDEHESNMLEVLNLALASLGAEPVAYRLWPEGDESAGFIVDSIDDPAHKPSGADADARRWLSSPLYTAPPAPVVQDIGEISVGRLPTMNQDDYPGLGDWWVQLRIGKDSDEVLARVYGATPQEANSRAEALACRAAMLQGAEPVKTGLTLREGLAAIRNSGIAIDAGKIQAERDALNSPVIPDGWVMVPVEPTEEMNKAGWVAMNEHDAINPTYRAMLAAAPDFRETPDSSTSNCRENAETSTKCWCRTCRPVTIADMRFVVCPECGNKRCPHANDHRNFCTGSNEPGQEGSAYPAAPQQEVRDAKE